MIGAHKHIFINYSEVKGKNLLFRIYSHVVLFLILALHRTPMSMTQMICSMSRHLLSQLPLRRKAPMKGNKPIDSNAGKAGNKAGSMGDSKLATRQH